MREFSLSVRDIVAGVEQSLLADGHVSVVAEELEAMRARVEELVGEVRLMAFFATFDSRHCRGRGCAVNLIDKQRN